MIDDFEVPQAYQTAFRRLRRRMPAELQADPAVLETALIYLKIGGEKLAAHRLSLYRKQFESECRLFRRRLVGDSIEDGEDAESDEDEGAEDAAEGDDAVEDD